MSFSEGFILNPTTFILNASRVGITNAKLIDGEICSERTFDQKVFER